VEYSNIHNPDASMIQPEWHGWMHHVFDETPDQPLGAELLKTVEDSNAPYFTHVAKTNPMEHRGQVDTSQYRQRGYKVGSLMTGENEEDFYYKQPGHPLSKDVEKARFKQTKGSSGWNPESS
jgi:hypothetical protein